MNKNCQQIFRDCFYQTNDFNGCQPIYQLCEQTVPISYEYYSNQNCETLNAYCNHDCNQVAGDYLLCKQACEKDFKHCERIQNDSLYTKNYNVMWILLTIILVLIMIKIIN